MKFTKMQKKAIEGLKKLEPSMSVGRDFVGYLEKRIESFDHFMNLALCDAIAEDVLDPSRENDEFSFDIYVENSYEFINPEGRAETVRPLGDAKNLMMFEYVVDYWVKNCKFQVEITRYSENNIELNFKPFAKT